VLERGSCENWRIAALRVGANPLARQDFKKLEQLHQKGDFQMASIKNVAEAFFSACESGKGWEACSAYCTPNATFQAQAEPLLEVKTLAQYTDWMKGILTVLPDGHYELKSFAIRRSAEQRCCLRRFPRHSYWLRRSGSSDGTTDEHRLRLCHAVRR
jgi:hypothetical protein